jgi:anti-sigma-K factor RskA
MKLDPPRSLGVSGGAPRAASRLRSRRGRERHHAAPVEPPDGSPKRKPSGPPVFVGKLIPVRP